LAADEYDSLPLRWQWPSTCDPQKDPWCPPLDHLHPALGHCKACNASEACGTIFVERCDRYGQPSPRTGKRRCEDGEQVPQPCQKCSNDYTDPKRPPCCQYCCPRNYTEQFYYDHPEEYDRHPPTFLAQMSTADKNADLCAARNCEP
jgi:hypothetical protein